MSISSQEATDGRLARGGRLGSADVGRAVVGGVFYSDGSREVHALNCAFYLP